MKAASHCTHDLTIRGWLSGLLLVTIIQVWGCANFDLVSVAIPEWRQVNKFAAKQERPEENTTTPKRLDFNQLTINYVKTRLHHPQLLELLEHAQWRPHPKQDAWLEHPFRTEPASRYVLKINPPEPEKSDTTEQKAAVPQTQEQAINSVEHIYHLQDMLTQGGYASLKHVVYLHQELSTSADRGKLLEDLSWISKLKGDAGQHARILYLTNADELDSDYLTETQEHLTAQKSWNSISERTAQAAFIGAYITALTRQYPDDPLAGLKPVGAYLSETSLPDEIRGEMFLQLAQYLPPVMIPGLQESLEAGQETPGSQKATALIKQYAMQANLVYALNHPAGKTTSTNMPHLDQPYPEVVWQMEWAEDFHLRRLYAYWLTLVKPAQGLEILKRQLMDHNPEVRDAVLLSLGYWPDKEAKALLLKYAKNPAENIRLACVAGLAGHGHETLRLLAQDEAHRVRAQVAVELGFTPSLEAAVIMQNLLVDQNSHVELTAMNQLETWPDSWAVPLCINSVIYSSRAVRLKAAYQLQKRTGMVITQLDGSVTERRHAVFKLAAEREIPTNFWNQLMQPQSFTHNEQQAHEQEVERWLKQLQEQSSHQTDVATQIKIELVKSDIPLIENFLKAHPESGLRYQVLQELARSFPEFELINQLSSQDVQQRRKAARSLADYAQQASLSPLLLEEVARMMEPEQDEQVWRSIAQAIAHDAGETQIRIARMMLKNRWVDLQKLGCDFAAEHQLGTLAPDILLLFQSRDHGLIQKAVYTAGKLGNPSVIDHPQGGLRSLLNHPASGVRKEASIALARLRDPQGIADLVRLAHSSDPNTRFAAIELIGELHDPSLVKQLHQLIWLEQDQRVKTCLVKSLEQLTPTSAWPYDQGKQLTDQERVTSWITYLNAR